MHAGEPDPISTDSKMCHCRGSRSCKLLGISFWSHDLCVADLACWKGQGLHRSCAWGSWPPSVVGFRVSVQAWYLGQTFALILKCQDLLAHGIYLGHYVHPEVVAIALDGRDDIHIQPARQPTPHHRPFAHVHNYMYTRAPTAWPACKHPSADMAPAQQAHRRPLQHMQSRPHSCA